MESTELNAARDILDGVKGKTLTEQQRKELSIHLAAHMLAEATRTMTWKEKKIQGQLARMMKDPKGKAFTTSMTDECFRSKRPGRVADQMVYLLKEFGIPQYLSPLKRLQLSAFQAFGKAFSHLFIPLATYMLRKETSAVILPGEPKALSHHMHKRRQEGVRLNLNHLGEAILGEEEANRRLNVYLEDLARDDIEYISIKISTIFSQINLLSWDKTLDTLAQQLRKLYRVAMTHRFKRADGTCSPKFVNLDMEEYRDLHLTIALFEKVLSEAEFHAFSAGIVLQAYLPDSHEMQKRLTAFAQQRVAAGGAPIKIRIVKGANLAMEQVEASLRDWSQAPYKTKAEVDANYKRMVTYGCKKEHAHAVHLGIASHNLFDIAYAMLLRVENQVEKEVTFEMLEGMADHIRRVVQKLVGDILLYCPVATKEDFQSAVAYLIRRLDENTGPDNFLRHTFGLKPNTQTWDEQALLFSQSVDEMNQVSAYPRRKQDRFKPAPLLAVDAPFENEPDTDFSLPENREWANGIRAQWREKTFENLPCVIDGEEIRQENPEGRGVDPSIPGKTLYTYTLASWEQVDRALNVAKSAQESWGSTSVRERCELLAKCAQKLRDRRGDLLGVMMADCAKTFFEGDPEISEAIDFADYYLRSMLKMEACKDLHWSPKGTILVAPPWNFPSSIPVGGILAALVAGNCVLFKPAPEAVLTGWVLVNALWDAGVPKKVLQYFNCADDPVGSKLIADPRLSAVILTGATSTAKLFHKIRPGIHLFAETGGKNAVIVSSLSDRDLAIKDLVHSAFSHSGQKCSAASLAILEAEVYDDSHFRNQLKDAVMSLTVGSAWDFSSKVVPVIREPNEALLRGLTTLEEGEEWLVQPQQDPQNPSLWSPGVKLGVKPGSFMHQTELFGPVLGVMRAKNLDHAIELANGTPYGLTSGLESLDIREQQDWLKKIEAGNLYINRGITGAIVRRQPFGGCKASSYGHGAKAGGPNYVAQFATPKQVFLPQEKHAISEAVNALTDLVKKVNLRPEELGIWFASIANYSYWAEHLGVNHDPSKIIGQDNFFRYRPQTRMCYRVQAKDNPLDLFRIIAAALSCKTALHINYCRHATPVDINDQWRHLPYLTFIEEHNGAFLKRVEKGDYKRVRLATLPHEDLIAASAPHATLLDSDQVLATGRFELLHYLREEAVSIDYHRYGNLGLREGEKRKPLL